MCELLKVCRIYDEGDATITSFKVSPTSGPQGNPECISRFYHMTLNLFSEITHVIKII